MPNFRRTKPFKPDPEKIRKILEELTATRGNTVDDVADLPDSLPLNRTRAVFLGQGRERIKPLAKP